MASPFDAADNDASGWVWMNHSGGVPAHFPPAAVDLWKARGWEPCDPPAEVDPTRIEQQLAVTPPAKPDPAEAPEPDAKPSADTKE